MRARALTLLVVLLGGTLPAAAYNRTRSTGAAQSGLAWFERTITWHLPAPGSGDVPHEAVVAAAKRAFAAWAAVGCTDVNFTFVAGGPSGTSLDGGEADGVNVIRWRERDWPGAPDQIALTTVTYDPGTGRILDVDIDLNGEYLFFTASDDPQATEYDVESALLHEVGHLLGFDDSADAAAVMAQVLGRGDVRRALADDDAAAVCAVYPAGAPTPWIGAFDLDLHGGCQAAASAPSSAAAGLLLGLLGLCGLRAPCARRGRRARSRYTVRVTLDSPRGRSGSRSRDRAR